ncbi:MAG TPA: S8 family serine peptidase [Draconibacterium sp.]|nr:S8 family serine peptidase [Draconibacterium sp.]
MEKSFFLSKKLFGILVGILAFGFFFGCQNDLLQTENTNDMGTLKSAKTANFMVISKSETLTDDLEQSLTKFGTIVKTIPQIGIVVLKTSDPKFVTKVIKLNDVRSVVRDYKARWLEPENFLPMANPPSIGDDEYFFWAQWGLDAINAPEAWNAGVTGENAKVFILDNGIDAEHPDLAPNLNTSLCASFVPEEDWNIQPGFYFNHGTHVAGIIAAADNLATDPNAGVIGVAPHAEIVAVKVLSEYDGSGDFSWIIAGMVYAANSGANVINMSLGATFARNGFYIDENGELQKVPASDIQEIIIASQRAVNYAIKKGAVVVASAGNGGSNFDGNAFMYKLPAELNNVIAVSAIAPNYWATDYINGIDPFLDIPASYTDFGRSLVDIAAPGGDDDFYPQPNWYYDMVLSTISDGWGFAAGTSMAAPHVAGVAALIIAKNGGDITPQEVEKQLLKTADQIDGNGKSLFFGKGRVNAYRAVTE